MFLHYVNKIQPDITRSKKNNWSEFGYVLDVVGIKIF